MEHIYESKAIYKNRHNSSGIFSAEFMQCGLNIIKNGKKTPKHLNDYLP